MTGGITGGTRARSVNWLRFGFLGDGCFKLLVAATYVALLPPLADVLGADRWLLIATAALVAASGVAEIAFAVRSGAGSHTRYLIAYDSGWVAATVAATLLAANGVAVAGTLWLVFQLLASPLVAAVFAFGARRGRLSDGDRGAAHGPRAERGRARR